MCIYGGMVNLYSINKHDKKDKQGEWTNPNQYQKVKDKQIDIGNSKIIYLVRGGRIEGRKVACEWIYLFAFNFTPRTSPHLRHRRFRSPKLL